MNRVAKTIATGLLAVAVVSCNRSTPGAGSTQQASTIATSVPTQSPIAAVEYVTDEAKVLDEASRKQLETRLAALKERKKIDFSIVTVRTTGDKSARDFSLGLARERKNNSIEQNVSGLLLLVAVDDRNWHIQITRNLEVSLTNELLTELSVPMTDSFRQNRYGEGILKYVNALIAKLEQMDLPEGNG
jgi:uncharacterized membrane protein YgcG